MEQTTIPIEKNEQGFTIRDSRDNPVTTAMPPDSGVCADCLEELFDPTSRYYHYPFVNCTHCGPRYSVVKQLPYDRCNTSLAAFTLCPDCAAEYRDTANRRFHAQATACPACGPRLSMPIPQILQNIQAGFIVAIKGLGGFHLVCDAHNHEAVQRLRHRKNREAKPFAIMAANIKTLDGLVNLSTKEKSLLRSPQRPIVLASKGDAPMLSPDLAPELNSLGVMLPYTPLHYLLFNAARGGPDGTTWIAEANDLVLVMTSANPGGEPLVTDNGEALRRLGDIADVIVDHNRDITSRCDDSVMQVVDAAPFFIRRARGFTPLAIKLPYEIPPTLAVGAYLKNTVCVTRGDEAFLSQHIGDMDNRATHDFFEHTVQHLLHSLDVIPHIIAHDYHRDFYSTRFAHGLDKPTIAVQHHHAHLAAVAAEHGVRGKAIGLALDGFGLGENNQSWGGELLLLDGAQHRRLGHLSQLKQPGGDSASREPWRMAAAVFDRLERTADIAQHFRQQGAPLLQQMLAQSLNCPTTSSAGRLFDAAAGLLNIVTVNRYEGQAAMMLESLVTTPQIMHKGWQIKDNQLDFLPLLERLLDCDPIDGANLFHGTLIAGLAQWVEQNAQQTGVVTVLLGGGCFLNKVLRHGLVDELAKKNLNAKLPRQAPVNDGGLSLGQAWVAGLTATSQ
jgi:hydrogenase maturation protein HypF